MRSMRHAKIGAIIDLLGRQNTHVAQIMMLWIGMMIYFLMPSIDSLWVLAVRVVKILKNISMLTW